MSFYFLFNITFHNSFYLTLLYLYINTSFFITSFHIIFSMLHSLSFSKENMVTSVDHDQNSGSMGESQLWGDLTNLDNIGGSSKRNLDMNSLNRNKVINEGGVVLVNGKPSRGGLVIKSGKNIKNGKGKGGKYRDSHHEMHIWNERERRKKIRNMFASLHALLPDLPSKVNSCSSSFFN